MNPNRNLRALVARAHAAVHLGPGVLPKPKTDIERVAPLVVQALDEQPVSVRESLFNDPPIFPYDIRIGVDAGAVASGGAVTAVAQLAGEQNPPPRHGGPPNGCPCTAIYTVCRCPARR